MAFPHGVLHRVARRIFPEFDDFSRDDQRAILISVQKGMTEFRAAMRESGYLIRKAETSEVVENA